MAGFDNAKGMGDDIAVRADNISKKFLLGRRSTSLKDRLTGINDRNREEFWAFENVSVEVPKGSMLGVIGRNGSGKSTFLRALCGVYRPTIGEVHVRGRITALLELGAGFHGELTGRENVYMNGAVVGLDRDYMDSVMDQIIEMADIGSFVDAPIETYSSGMRARLGFAVSVQMQPEILLADEITAVGDIAFKEHGIRRMNELREAGATIIQVSHNLTMLEKNCDQVLWLHHGKTRRLGDPEEVIEEYREQSNVDRSGRMIGATVPVTPQQKARQRKQAEIAETLAAEDRNSSWFTRIRLFGPDRGDPVAGLPARIKVKVRPDHDVVAPSIQIRVLAKGGRPTGFGFDSGPLDAAMLAEPIEATVESLGLAAGRFNLRVDLLSAGTVVATRHKRVVVEAPDLSNGAFAAMPARWGIASTTSSG